MISSIRLDGTTACMHLPGAADTAAFVTYLGEVPEGRFRNVVRMQDLGRLARISHAVAATATQTHGQQAKHEEESA